MAIIEPIPGHHCKELSIPDKIKGNEKTLEMGELVVLEVLSEY
jgi:hypothetical protein